ncbi:MAG: cation transporting ATPase C-terminal domain-containing protein [Pseudonocardiaceae bacterium]|jgi:Mg2+-importing ATPase
MRACLHPTPVIFAIRTRRIPFFRSHPSVALTLAALGIVVVGTLLPATPLAHSLGFQPLPAGFFAALAGMVVCYLVLIEIGKRIFYGSLPSASPTRRNYSPHHHLRRRAAYFSTATRHAGLISTSDPPPGRHRHSQVSEYRRGIAPDLGDTE